MKTLLKAWGSVIVLILVALAIADGFFIYLTDKRASPELIHGLGEIVWGIGGFFAFYFFLITIPILIVYVIMTCVLKAHTPF